MDKKVENSRENDVLNQRNENATSTIFSKTTQAEFVVSRVVSQVMKPAAREKLHI